MVKERPQGYEFLALEQLCGKISRSEKIEREVYLNHNYLFLQNQHKLLDYFSRKVIPKPCSTTSGMEEEKRGPRVCSEVLSKLLSGLMSSAFILKGENKTEYKLKGRRGAANGGERA